ncbi:hypothetical protein K0M31_018338, partial [Melipona bicolor]
MAGWAAGAWLSRNKKIPSSLVAGTMIKGWGSCRERDRIVRGRVPSLCTHERRNSTTSLLLQIVILGPRIWLQTNLDAPAPTCLFAPLYVLAKNVLVGSLKETGKMLSCVMLFLLDAGLSEDEDR